jgi:LPS-assembly protein
LAGTRPGPDTPVDLTADKAHIKLNGTSVLLGDVEMWRGGQFLRADELYYTRPDGYIEARGQVRFEHEGLTVTGPSAELWLNRDDARFTAPAYQFAPRHARGKASLIERESPNVAVLEDATFTTCDPGDTDWLLSAGRVTLDRESGDGTARNVLLRFKNVPLLYTPWIRFPIDDRRQSGFLFPSAGTSSRSGIKLEAPYYWNIAPHRDATFTPRILTARGLQLETEFRYLNASNTGKLGLEFLDDRKFEDQRYLANIIHTGSPSPRLRTLINASSASDDQYFEDFGNSLSTA